MKKVNIRNKLNIVLILTFLFALSVSSYFLRLSLNNTALNELKKLSYLQMDMAQAVRKYTSEHIKQNVSNEDSFHEITVPSFAATTIMENLNLKYEKTKYVEVALNPTNPNNQARGWQIDIIKEFADNPQITEIFRVTKRGEIEYFNFLKPLRVTSESCLNCHSSPERAPISMLQKYGDQNGFNWQLNQTIGVQIVSVPTDVAMKTAQMSLLGYIGLTVIICGFFFIVLNIMLNHVVINPIETKNEQLQQISRQDSLTGVLNRRGFDEVLNQFIENQNKFSIISMDIDFLKKINDNYGHVVGDFVLKEFAERIQKICQNKYFFSRISGEEFVLITLNKNSEEAHELALELKLAITEAPFMNVGRMTCSFGITQFNNHDSAKSLLSRVDQALYHAKQKGRNRIEIVNHADDQVKLVS